MQPGMVLYIEPNFVTEYGNFILEENVVVTEDGHQTFVEPLPEELSVIPDIE